MSAVGQEYPDPGAGRRAIPLPLVVILGLALALRLAHWAAVRSAPFVAQLVVDSWEYDRWARQIAAGDWLGHGVFFQAPLYPYLLAVLYRVAGHSLDAVYLAQIALAVAGCFALYRAGRAMAGERAALAAAALAAIYGPFLFYDVQLLKESLAVTVACFLLWALGAAWAPATAGAEPRATGWRWLLAGALLGVLALLRENALLVAPLLVPLAWRGGGGVGRALRLGAFAGGILLVLAPVALRNGLVGGDFLPTTFQGGVNFYIGNNPRADGTYRPIVPGKQAPELERKEPARIAEQELGRRLGEGEVSRYWLGRALAWAREHPGDFLRLTLRKLGLFWSWYEWPDAVDYYDIRGQSPVYRLPLLEFGGLTLLAALGLGYLGGGMARRLAPALLFAAGWMLATAVFFLFARYRLPAVPALMLLAALPVADLVESLGSWRRGKAARTAESGQPRLPWRAVGLGLVVVAALALPRVAGFAPRRDLVQFNLGRLAEERGDGESARRHYQAVLAVAPDDFLAWLDLGNLAARRRDWQEALACYQRAAALEPASDDAQSNLGGVYLALGDLPAAASHLDRALALNSRSVQALQNGALLRLRLGDLQGARELNRRTLEVDPTNPAAGRLRDRLASLASPP